MSASLPRQTARGTNCLPQRDGTKTGNRSSARPSMPPKSRRHESKAGADLGERATQAVRSAHGRSAEPMLGATQLETPAAAQAREPTRRQNTTPAQPPMSLTHKHPTATHVGPTTIDHREAPVREPHWLAGRQRTDGPPEQWRGTRSVSASLCRRASRLTFDMRGGRKWAKPACGRPLDGRVRPHRSESQWETSSRTVQVLLG